MEKKLQVIGEKLDVGYPSRESIVRPVLFLASAFVVLSWLGFCYYASHS